jgi:hypothetical protein
LKPDEAKTRSAMTICCSRVASHGCGANSAPPNDSQVDQEGWWANCSPPPNPLPVFADQSPPVSQSARRSQRSPEGGAGVVGTAAGAAADLGFVVVVTECRNWSRSVSARAVAL